MPRRVLYKIREKIGTRALKKSVWLLHYDASSCNGCSIEIVAALSPRYDVERFGIIEENNPRHADMLLFTGAVNPKSARVLKTLYEQTPSPKVVVVVGSCGTSKGVYYDCYNIVGPIDQIVPVDVYVPGCPPRPEAIIDGIIKGLEAFEKKR